MPEGGELADLTPLLPVLLSYILSFVYIGIYWNNHHHLLQTVERTTGGILWANLHLLFWLSLLPFATGWMGENHFVALPTALYGFVLLMAAIAYYILERQIISSQGADSILAQAVGRDLKGRSIPGRLRAGDPTGLRLGVGLGRPLRRSRGDVARTGPSDRTGPAMRLLLHGGPIYAPSVPHAGAMLVVDGTIAWIGPASAAAVHRDSADAVVDLDGALVAPAFVDAHVHHTATGMTLLGLDLRGVPSRVALLDRLDGRGPSRAGPAHRRPRLGRGTVGRSDAAHARGAGPGDLGFGRLPVACRRALGDRVERTGRPGTGPAGRARVRGVRSGHGRRPPPGPAVRPRGAARGLAGRRPAGDAGARRRGRGRRAARGGRSRHQRRRRPAGPARPRPLDRRSGAGGLLGRGRGSGRGAGAGRAGSGGGPVRRRRARLPNRLPAGALRRRAQLAREPVPGAESVAEHLVACTRAGVQAGFHAIGDAALDIVVAGLRDAMDQCGPPAVRAARHRVEHLTMARPEHAAVLAEAGVVASVQPLFDAHWGSPDGVYAARLGPDRWAGSARLRGAGPVRVSHWRSARTAR